MDQSNTEVEIFSKAIDTLLLARRSAAERGTIEPIVLDETMSRLGRAFSACWDLRYNKRRT